MPDQIDKKMVALGAAPIRVKIKGWDPDKRQGYTFVRGVRIHVGPTSLTNPKEGNLVGLPIEFSGSTLRVVKKRNASGVLMQAYAVIPLGCCTIV